VLGWGSWNPPLVGVDFLQSCGGGGEGGDIWCFWGGRGGGVDNRVGGFVGRFFALGFPWGGVCVFLIVNSFSGRWEKEMFWSTSFKFRRFILGVGGYGFFAEKGFW